MVEIRDKKELSIVLRSRNPEDACNRINTIISNNK